MMKVQDSHLPPPPNSPRFLPLKPCACASFHIAPFPQIVTAFSSTHGFISCKNSTTSQTHIFCSLTYRILLIASGSEILTSVVPSIYAVIIVLAVILLPLDLHSSIWEDFLF